MFDYRRVGQNEDPAVYSSPQRSTPHRNHRLGVPDFILVLGMGFIRRIGCCLIRLSNLDPVIKHIAGNSGSLTASFLSSIELLINGQFSSQRVPQNRINRMVQHDKSVGGVVMYLLLTGAWRESSMSPLGQVFHRPSRKLRFGPAMVPARLRGRPRLFTLQCLGWDASDLP